MWVPSPPALSAAFSSYPGEGGLGIENAQLAVQPVQQGFDLPATGMGTGTLGIKEGHNDDACIVAHMETEGI